MKLSTVDTFKHISSTECLTLTQEQIDALHQVMLTILDDIVSVCETHHLNYSLGGGSVLGAVRHQGFIPWDDDIDLNMPRRDYESFIEYFEKEFGHKYWIHRPCKTHNYARPLTQVRLKGTTLKTREDFFNEECGAFVDIFPVENTYDNPLLRSIHGFFSLVFGFLLSCRKFYRDRHFLMKLVQDNPSARNTFRIKIAIGALIAFCPIDFLTRTADRWYSICKNYNSRRVVIPSGRKHFFGETYLRHAVCDTRQMCFENRMVNCPADSDGYLKNLYGDYMQIPAPEDRERHIVFPPFDLGDCT